MTYWIEELSLSNLGTLIDVGEVGKEVKMEREVAKMDCRVTWSRVNPELRCRHHFQLLYHFLILYTFLH